MNIFGVMPNIVKDLKVQSAQRSDNSNINTGPSFTESFMSVAQAANIQVANGNGSSALNLNRQKEDQLEKLFSFSETEEEILDESLAKIKKMLGNLKK